MGFCLFNFAVVAAEHAFETYGVKRIAMLDWDVHHGNGVAALVDGDERIRYASLHEEGNFPNTGRADDRGSKGAQNLLHVPMEPGSGWEEYEVALEETVLPWLSEFDADLVIVSAGYDALALDPLANMMLDAEVSCHSCHPRAECLCGTPRQNNTQQVNGAIVLGSRANQCKICFHLIGSQPIRHLPHTPPLFLTPHSLANHPWGVPNSQDFGKISIMVRRALGSKVVLGLEGGYSLEPGACSGERALGHAPCPRLRLRLRPRLHNHNHNHDHNHDHDHDLTPLSAQTGWLPRWSRRSWRSQQNLGAQRSHSLCVLRTSVRARRSTCARPYELRVSIHVICNSNLLALRIAKLRLEKAITADSWRFERSLRRCLPGRRLVRRSHIVQHQPHPLARPPHIGQVSPRVLASQLALRRRRPVQGHGQPPPWRPPWHSPGRGTERMGTLIRMIPAILPPRGIWAQIYSSVRPSDARALVLPPI